MKSIFAYCCLLLFCMVLLPNPIWCQQKLKESPCPKVVTKLITQLVVDVPIADLPRVEVRQCSLGELQIVAWAQKSSSPSLVVNTTDFTIVQVAARDNVFMIETTGGPRDIVHVVTYRNREPALSLKRVTKGTADVAISKTLFKLVISDFYGREAEPKTDTYKFELSLEDLYKR